MKRARPADDNKAGQPKRKNLGQPSMHAFFGGNPGPSTLNPALQYGIRVYSTSEISEAEGMEGEFRSFWNEKAAELCSNIATRQKLGSKSGIQGAIHTAWSLHKTNLLELKMDKLRFAAREAYQEDETVIKKLTSIERNLVRMQESNGRMHFLSQELQSGNGDIKSLGDQMKSELSELQLAQEALKKGIQRRYTEINVILQERQQVLPPPQLSEEEEEQLVLAVQEEAEYEEDHDQEQD